MRKLKLLKLLGLTLITLPLTGCAEFWSILDDFINGGTTTSTIKIDDSDKNLKIEYQETYVVNITNGGDFEFQAGIVANETTTLWEKENDIVKLDDFTASSFSITGLLTGKSTIRVWEKDKYSRNYVFIKVEVVGKTDHEHSYEGKYFFNDSQHWQKCSCGTAGPKSNHNLTEEITKPATSTTDGLKTISCTVCDYSKTETIPAGGGGGDNTLSKTVIKKTFQNYTDNSVYEIDNCPLTGSPKLLIIPIWFTDSGTYIKTTNKENVRSDIEKAYIGTEEETGWHSVKSFYATESQNKLTLDATVSSWYECGKASTNYYTSSEATSSLVADATKWYFTNNTSDSRRNYDSDKDGYLDGVMLIYASPDYVSMSKGSADNMWAYCFWLQDSSNKSQLAPGPNVFFWASYDFMYNSSTASTRTGKSNYGYGDTRYCSIDAHTYIHEMGHVLGYDDYYDYSNTYNPAAGFSMQDNNVGSHDPYSIMASGWADPYIPTSTTTIEIGSFQETHDLILLTPSWNDSDSAFDEYLLLELYTPTGLNKLDCDYKYGGKYAQGPSSTGIRLWHVDARLIGYSTSKGDFTTPFFTNPDSTPSGLFGAQMAMSNTYDLEGYCSPLGSEYYNFNELQLIRNNKTATYKATDNLASSHLFGNGSTFDMNSYRNQFYKSGKLNSNTSLGWSFSVSITGSGSSAKASVTCTKA